MERVALRLIQLELLTVLSSYTRHNNLIHGLATEHVVPNVRDHGFTGGNEDGTETNMAAEDAEFLEAMLRRHAEDPSVFFMKGIEALMKVAEEPLYDESKGCTKEFTTLRSVLKLLVCKARYGLSDAGFDAFLIFCAKGVQIFDEYRKESFTLRAIIFVTINDYPAPFTLSG